MPLSDNSSNLKSTLKKEKNREDLAGTFTTISPSDRDGFSSSNNRKNRDGLAGTFTTISPSFATDPATDSEFRSSTGSDGARDIPAARKKGRKFTVPKKQKKNVIKTSVITNPHPSSEAEDPASSVQSPTDNAGERRGFDDDTCGDSDVGREDETAASSVNYRREDAGHGSRGGGGGALQNSILDPMGNHGTPMWTTSDTALNEQNNRRRGRRSNVDVSDSITSNYTHINLTASGHKSELSESINDDLIRSGSRILIGLRRNNKIYTQYALCIFFLIIVAAFVAVVVFFIDNGDKNDDTTIPLTAPTSAPTPVPTIMPEFFNCKEQRTDTDTSPSCTSSSFQSTCYKNTVAILNAEREAFRIYRHNINVDPNATLPQRTYHLCCNIHLNIGQYDYNTDSFLFGMAYINLFLPSVTILCGPDGSSINNCTLSGGTNHLVVVPAEEVPGYGIDDTVPIYDIAIHGIMFEGALFGSAFLQDAGDVTFVDCHFRYNRAKEGIITSIITREETNSSSLAVVPAIHMENCTVWHNVLTATANFPHGGLVYVQRGKVDIINSIFARNWMERTNFKGLLAPIFARYVADDQTVGGGRMDVTVQDSCFVDNFGASFAPVLVDLDDVGVRAANGNYYHLGETVKPVPSQLNLQLGVDLNAVERLVVPEEECAGIGEMREKRSEIETNCTVSFDMDFCRSSVIIPC